jgi:hypothetical protein
MRYADSKCTYTENFANGNHVYIFTGPCIVTKKMVSVEVPAEGLFAYRQGAFVQDAFPNLSKDDREFLMSGMSAEGWGKTFASDEE